MKSRLYFSLIATFAFFSPYLMAADTPRPTASPTTQRVVKLISTSGDDRTPFGGRGFGRGPGGGRNNPPANANQPTVPYMVVTPPEGGQPVKLLVTDEYKRKLPSLEGERGNLITITIKVGSLGSELVTGATAFDGPKELKRDNVFIYDGIGQEKMGVQMFTSAKLSKFGQSRVVLVSNRPSFEGAKPQPDPALISSLNALTIGDAVEVEVVPGPARNSFYLVDIGAPREPLIGAFVKLTSLKDSANKTVAGIVLDVDGEEKSFALPAQNPASTSNALATAVNMTAHSLKPGYSVRFNVRQAEGQLPTVRSMRLDGSIEPVNEKYFSVISTYVKVEFSDNFFSRDKEPNVDYKRGSNNEEDHFLERGVSRVLESDKEIERIKLTEDQTKQLNAAMDAKAGRNPKPTPVEKSQWIAGYNAWLNAQDEASRTRIEQELLRAGQELSGRWEKETREKLHSIRKILTAEQLEEVRKLGEPRQAPFGI